MQVTLDDVSFESRWECPAFCNKKSVMIYVTKGNKAWELDMSALVPNMKFVKKNVDDLGFVQRVANCVLSGRFFINGVSNQQGE